MRKKLLPVLLIVAGVLAISIVALLLVNGGSQPQTSPATPTAEPVAQDTVPAAAPTATPDVLPAIDASSSPQDIVQFYFARWNAKDTGGMDDCRIEADRELYPYDDLQYEASVDLISLSTVPSDELEGRFNEEWYANPHGIALVEANFTITYNDEGKELHVSDGVTHDGYMFWLVKEEPDGPWQIVMQGY